MTCKDCIHYDVCKYKNRQIPLCDEFHYETDHVEDIGCPFIDKSKFIELPCKVGDTVWCVDAERKYVENYIVYSIEKFGGLPVTEIRAYNHFATFSRIGFASRCFGETVFLTREEAEKALKERESNA